MTAFIKADTHLTLVFDDGDSATVYSTNNKYDAVCDAVRNKDWELAKELALPVELIKKSIAGIENVAIEGGFVTYNGTPLHTTLTARMLEMYADDFDIAPMAIFLDNLMDNPSNRAVNELYDFLEASKLPITEDGHFLAYKRVNEHFKDIYTGRVDNTPGAFVEMQRNTVNEDKHNTCSHGLHFCARSYLPHYGTSYSNKVVMIKINPRDVVAIPSDYDNAKGRCCAYTVVRELPTDEDSYGNLPTENLECSFRDSRTVVSSSAVEQLNLAEALSSDKDPSVIATFDSPEDAGNDSGIDAASIVKACMGTRRSAGGFGWRWASNNPNNYVEDFTLDIDVIWADNDWPNSQDDHDDGDIVDHE